MKIEFVSNRQPNIQHEERNEEAGSLHSLCRDSHMPLNGRYYGVPMGQIPFTYLMRLYKDWKNFPNRSYQQEYMDVIEYLERNRDLLSP